jgi:KDO2-lipid IV(A) lauroyltransferase
MANLHRAFSATMSEPEMRRLCRNNFRLFAKSLLEFLSSPYLAEGELRRRVELQGTHFLRDALKKGNGVIILTGHFGNWEWMGARACAEGLPLAVIVRPHSDPATEALISGIRTHNGLRVIPRNDARAAMRSLRNNEILGILADQHAGDSGIPIPFFGQPASTYPGIAALAIRTGAQVIPGFCVRRPDDTHLVTLYPPVKLIGGADNQEAIRANTALCAKIIEEQIRKHPDHWMWFHNRWKS